MSIPKTTASSQLHVRVTSRLVADLKEQAAKQHICVSQLVRSLLARGIAEADLSSGSMPDESAIREMAILIAVELVLKLQEASIPGGVTLSRRLLEDAARAAIGRIESVEANLRKDAGR